MLFLHRVYPLMPIGTKENSRAGSFMSSSGSKHGKQPSSVGCFGRFANKNVNNNNDNNTTHMSLRHVFENHSQSTTTGLNLSAMSSSANLDEWQGSWDAWDTWFPFGEFGSAPSRPSLSKTGVTQSKDNKAKNQEPSGLSTSGSGNVRSTAVEDMSVTTTPSTASSRRVVKVVNHGKKKNKNRLLAKAKRQQQRQGQKKKQVTNPSPEKAARPSSLFDHPDITITASKKSKQAKEASACSTGCVTTSKSSTKVGELLKTLDDAPVSSPSTAISQTPTVDKNVPPLPSMVLSGAYNGRLQNNNLHSDDISEVSFKGKNKQLQVPVHNKSSDTTISLLEKDESRRATGKQKNLVSNVTTKISQWRRNPIHRRQGKGLISTASSSRPTLKAHGDWKVAPRHAQDTNQAFFLEQSSTPKSKGEKVRTKGRQVEKLPTVRRSNLSVYSFFDVDRPTDCSSMESSASNDDDLYWEVGDADDSEDEAFVPNHFNDFSIF